MCQKILKAMGPQKQIVAMNALYLAMQVVDSVSWRDAKPHNAQAQGGEPLAGEASPGATGSAAFDNGERNGN